MNNGNGLKFIFSIRASNVTKTKRLIEQFEKTRSKNTNWLLIIAYNNANKELGEYISILDSITPVEKIIISCSNNSGQMTNRIFKEANKLEFDFAFMSNDSIQLIKPGWDQLYHQAANYTKYDSLYFYDQENPVCNEAPRNWQPVINRCLLRHVRDSFFTYTKYVLNKIGYYNIVDLPILAPHDFFLRSSDCGFNDKCDPYDAYNSEQYIKCDPELPPFDIEEGKKLSGHIINHRVEFNDIYSKLEDCKKIVTFVMCLKDRSDRAIKSIKSIITTNNLKYIDFIIVEDRSNFLLDLSDFKHVDKIKHYIVNTGDSWNRSKLLNFGFKRAITPLVASWDCDIIFPRNFGKKLQEMCKSINFEKNIIKLNSKESDKCTVHGKIWKKGEIRGGMWLYDKTVLESIGGYDETFVEWGHEEMDVFERLGRAKNIEILESQNLEPQIFITHLSHSDYLRGECINNDRNYNIRFLHNQSSIINVNLNGWGNLPILRKSGSDSAFAKFLKGKRVAIIGPAPSIIGSKQKKKIDSYDIVIRINKAIPIPRALIKDTGSRCDVLYNCMNTSEECGGHIDFAAVKKNGVKWIACPYPKSGDFEKDINNFESINPGYPFHIIDMEKYYATENYIGTRPNSGIGAIIDILDYDIKELYVTGFTFFKGGYHKHYRGYSEAHVLGFMEKYGKHEQEAQRELIKEYWLYDDRLEVDKTLREILEK